jgi:hypothetical protein
VTRIREGSEHRPRISIEVRGRLVAVPNAKPAADIDMLERNTRCGQPIHEGGNSFQCCSKRLDVCQLRPDVAIDALHSDVPE